MVKRELELGVRVVAENEAFIGYCPWASRFPFEMQIVPRRHCADLREATDEEMRSLAEMLVELLQRLNVVAGRPPFNLVFHSSPADTPPEGFHWHIEIMPKLTTPAGFEWGTSAHINPLSPERAAQLLIRAGLAGEAAEVEGERHAGDACASREGQLRRRCCEEGPEGACVEPATDQNGAVRIGVAAEPAARSVATKPNGCNGAVSVNGAPHRHAAEAVPKQHDAPR
jgi:diadenosine tetraphosphate (Ap4A) HIT family hydrolase